MYLELVHINFEFGYEVNSFHSRIENTFNYMIALSILFVVYSHFSMHTSVKVILKIFTKRETLETFKLKTLFMYHWVHLFVYIHASVCNILARILVS